MKFSLSFDGVANVLFRSHLEFCQYVLNNRISFAHILNIRIADMKNCSKMQLKNSSRLLYQRGLYGQYYRIFTGTITTENCSKSIFSMFHSKCTLRVFFFCLVILSLDAVNIPLFSPRSHSRYTISKFICIGMFSLLVLFFDYLCVFFALSLCFGSNFLLSFALLTIYCISIE